MYVEIPSTNSCNEKNVLVLRKLHTKYQLVTDYIVTSVCARDLAQKRVLSLKYLYV